MSKKSISINPNFFKIGKSGGARKKEKKPRKEKPIHNLKPNNIKKKLIEKIKAHQKREKEKEILQEKEEEKEFQDSFKDTLNYLQDLDKKHKKKKKKKKNKTMKRNSIPINTKPMQNPPTTFSHTPAPPYGCLKGGNKPTFREYNKTLKKKREKDIPINTSNNFDGKNTDVLDTPIINLTSIKFDNNENFEKRKEKLQNLKNSMKSDKPKMKRIKTRRIRRKITLGKVKNKVGVLVKSKKTRKIIKNEVNVLKKKPIQEIKTYLKKHNLIKIGSSAPDYIFRTMYENAYLSGDISNKNDEILLHNWSKEMPV